MSDGSTLQPVHTDPPGYVPRRPGLVTALVVLLGAAIPVGLLVLGAFAAGGYVVYAVKWMH